MDSIGVCIGIYRRIEKDGTQNPTLGQPNMDFHMRPSKDIYPFARRLY